LQTYEVRVTASPGKYTFTTMMNMTSENWDEDLETYLVDSVKKLEAQHPDITIMDLADHSRMLPDNHPLTRTATKSSNRESPARDRSLVSQAQRSHFYYHWTNIGMMMCT